MSSPHTEMQLFVPMTTQKISQMSGFLSTDIIRENKVLKEPLYQQNKICGSTGTYEERSNFSLLEDNMGEL